MSTIGAAATNRSEEDEKVIDGEPIEPGPAPLALPRVDAQAGREDF